MPNNSERIERSLARLSESGGLDDQAAEALALAKPGQIGTALGEAADTPELLLVSVLVDDSTSIEKEIDDIRHGYSKLLTALRTRSFDAEVQFHARAMNNGVISPYTALAHAPSLTDANYNGSRLVPKTPLFLQTVLMLGTVLLKAQEEEDRGARVRTYTLIITDGEDNKSGGITVGHVRAMVNSMFSLWRNHIVAGMGVGERPMTHFRDVFTQMGIPKNRQYTPGTSIEQLQKDFEEIADMLALAASSETDFAQLLPGSAVGS